MPFVKKNGRRIPAGPRTADESSRAITSKTESSKKLQSASLGSVQQITSTNQSNFASQGTNRTTTTNKIPKLRPDDNDNRIFGPFEQKLQEEIHKWQCASFGNFAVDIELWPATDYEPDYSDLNFDRHKLFCIASKSGRLFPGTRILPFRYWEGYQISTEPNNKHRIRTEADVKPKTWCHIENWLSDLHGSAQWAYDYEASNILYSLWLQTIENRVSILGKSKGEDDLKRCLPGRILKLPLELTWMVFEQVMTDMEFFDCDGVSRSQNMSTPVCHISGATDTRAYFHGRRVLTGQVLQEMLDRYQTNNAFFETNFYGLDHFRHFVLHDWDLSRAFTEYMLLDSVLEFTAFNPDNKKDSFHRIMAVAPMYLLHGIKRLRLCWTRYKPGEDIQTWTNLTTRYLNSIAAPVHRSLPDWEVSALALLPKLEEVEIFFPANPFRYFAMPDWQKPCRTIFVDLILESFFPWITVPGIKVTLTGAVRSSQKERFTRLQNQALALSRRSRKRVLTQLERDEMVEAVRDSGSSSKNIRNRKQITTAAFDQKQREVNEARQKVTSKARQIAEAVDRYYMSGDTVSKNRPKQKREMIPALNNLNLHKCKCYPPCVAHERRRFRDVFFDDTDEGIAEYLQWKDLRDDEEYDSDETAGEADD